MPQNSPSTKNSTEAGWILGLRVPPFVSFSEKMAKYKKDAGSSLGLRVPSFSQPVAASQSASQSVSQSGRPLRVHRGALCIGGLLGLRVP